MATRVATAVRARPRRAREEEVLVWPDLVFVEFIAAVLFTISLLVLSSFLNAPLLDRADPDTTPNPSKAPGTSSTCRSCCCTWSRLGRG